MERVVIPTLETERLRLRPFRESDLDDYAALCADPEVSSWLVAGPLARDAAWRNLVYLFGHWLLRGCGTWAVEEKATGAFVGRIGFSDGEGCPGFELAWTLARRFWGRGYATEGARVALAHAFADLERDHVISLIRPHNRRSIRVAERIGEKLERSVEHMGKDFLVYGIRRESWEPAAVDPPHLLGTLVRRWGPSPAAAAPRQTPRHFSGRGAGSPGATQPRQTPRPLATLGAPAQAPGEAARGPASFAISRRPSAAHVARRLLFPRYDRHPGRGETVGAEATYTTT